MRAATACAVIAGCLIHCIDRMTAETIHGVTVEPDRPCAVAYDRSLYPYRAANLRPLLTPYLPYSDRTPRPDERPQVDHIVSLAEAHRSGACAMLPELRRAVANDLVNLTLAAAATNNAKSDNDRWLPDRNRCWYIRRRLAVKRLYGLTADPIEAQALRTAIAVNGCKIALTK